MTRNKKILYIEDAFENRMLIRRILEADGFTAKTYQKPEALISALKKLSVDNLSNLTPHRFYVFINYSHPPVLQRITALRKFKPSVQE